MTCHKNYNFYKSLHLRIVEINHLEPLVKKKQPAQEYFKDYVPEVMYYDPDVDGGSDHLIREDLLSEKERMKALITKRKEANRGDRKVRR